MESRITADLASKVDGVGPTEVVQVVVELRPSQTEMRPGLSRQDQLQYEKKSMLMELDSVREAIQRLGGEVVDSLWLNQTILADVPARQVRKLANIPKVSLVDLPHSLGF